MPKKMMINVMHPEEARIAIVEEGRLVELDIEIEGSEQTRGNVYKGVVVRVEPGLQAAFVDIGLKKLGFLQMGELHPDYWQWRDDIPEEQRKRRPRIQEVLRRGQEVIVQVEKGERDMKGAALTSYLSFPGRYMVIMPGSDSAGVSRKVESESDRKKLKEAAAEMKIPEGIGYIIRTEALGKTKTELKKDLTSLLKMHKEILAKAKKTKAPALVYQELDLVIRTIRDYFTAEIDEVLVDNPDVFQQAKAFFKATMPKQEHIVKLHQEKRPIFSKYQLEEQIDQIYEKKVPLKSGGSLVIEPTEALVSIDVNSGKSTGERGVEDTAFKTNIEAAEEAARQLRLRDLAGLIVIDFIDMRDKKHMIEVEKTLKNALKQDKARVTVGRISQFGMLEMSRQRIKQTLEQASYLECPHCGGRGKVKSVENMALSFLRKVHAAAAKGTTAEVRGGLPLEVAYYLLNRKKRELAQIENDYEIEVTIKGKPSFLMNQLEIELLKRERLPQTEVPAERAGVAPVTADAAEAAEGGQTETVAPMAAEEGKGKKKRRRKKKPRAEGEAVPAAGVSPDETAEPFDGSEDEEPSASLAAVAEGAEPAPDHPADEHKKKRKRKRRRGAKGHPVEGGAAEVPAGAEPTAGGVTAEPAAPVAEAAEPGEGGVPAEEHKRKRKRKRRRGAKAHPAEGAVPGAPAGEIPVETPEVPVPAAMMKTAEAVPGEQGAADEVTQKKRPKKRSRSGKSAGAEVPALTTGEGKQAEVVRTPPVVVSAPVETVPAVAKKPARAPRKKAAAATIKEPAVAPADTVPPSDAAVAAAKTRARKQAAPKKPAAAAPAIDAATDAKGPAVKKPTRKKRVSPAGDTAGTDE